MFSKRKPPPANESIDMDVLQQRLEEIKKKQKRATEILDVLGIPHHPGIFDEPAVPVIDLVKILTDEKKLKVIVSKLRNKAFW